MPKVSFKEFPDCCGAGIVSNTWVEGMYSHPNPALDTDIQYLKTNGLNPDGYNSPGVIASKRRSVLLAITIPRQVKQEEIFKKHKGICIGSFINVNTHCRCRIWMIPLNASAKPKCVTRWKKRSDA